RGVKLMGPLQDAHGLFGSPRREKDPAVSVDDARSVRRKLVSPLSQRQSLVGLVVQQLPRGVVQCHYVIWLRSKNIIVQINGNLFLHAGISPEFTSYGLSISQINTLVRQYLQSGYGTEPNADVQVILGSDGPLWYRGYFNTNTNTNTSNNNNYDSRENDMMPVVSQQFVDDFLNSKGLERMVIGHNEQLTINVSFNGRVISADVAIDESGKTSQGLLISGDRLYRCFSDGRKELLE
ncbi:MAG: hypothetical protein MUC31_01260, partial [Bacteroidales bacterium]|nr:hypothetical protein [Bacteroidales bacterium]